MNPVRIILLIAWSALISTIFLFFLLRTFPSFSQWLLKDSSPFLAHRSRYVPDATFGFCHRQADFVLDIDKFYGELWSPDFGYEPKPAPYHATYKGGFRRNSASLCEIAVIGDSFIEMGERDDLTFPELLRKHAGRNICNRGVGGYGPRQYLEVYRQLLASSPEVKTVVLSFYSGNDIADISNFDQMKKIAVEWSLFSEYLMTMKELLTIVSAEARRIFSREGRAPAGRAEEVAQIVLGEKSYPMVFRYFNPSKPAEDLRKEAGWKTLEDILREFRKIADGRGIRLVLVYVPTAVEVYGAVAQSKPGSPLFDSLQLQQKFGNNMNSAFRDLAAELGLPLIDLLPLFRSQSGGDELLYFQFDSHWSAHGRDLAAQAVAAALS